LSKIEIYLLVLFVLQLLLSLPYLLTLLFVLIPLYHALLELYQILALRYLLEEGCFHLTLPCMFEEFSPLGLPV